jgi:hypothetical protein
MPRRLFDALTGWAASLDEVDFAGADRPISLRLGTMESFGA